MTFGATFGAVLSLPIDGKTTMSRRSDINSSIRSATTLVTPLCSDQGGGDRTLAATYRAATDILQAAGRHAPLSLRVAAAILQAVPMPDSVRDLLCGVAATTGLAVEQVEQHFDPDAVLALGVCRDLIAKTKAARSRSKADGYRLPAGTPADRLHAKRQTMIRNVFEGSLRTAAAGHETTLVLGKAQEPALFRGGRVGTFVTNARGDQLWEPRGSYFSMRVPRDWLSRVHRRGLAVVDGRPTLDAVPVEGIRFIGPTIEIFEASWVVQRRGCAASAVSGYIARADGIACHADSVSGAISRLQRKRQAAKRAGKHAQALQALHGHCRPGTAA
jgi:hypothetical protein